MSRRMLLTLSTAACLWGLYSLYTLAVGPLVRIPSYGTRPVQQPLPELTGNVDNVRMAEAFLAQIDWLPTANYQSKRDEDGIYFYSNALEPDEEAGVIHFEPFAMIWRRKDAKPDEAPLTIVCDRADVRFEHAFSIEEPDPGRPIGGNLIGRVSITGPDGMWIEGSNFYFSEQAQRIWSDNHARFAFDNHTGSAERGVQIDLVPTDGVPPKDRPAIADARSVQLRGQVNMDLAFEENGKLQPLHVSCLDSLIYDLQTQEATFSNTVHVYRQLPNGQKQGLRCDELSLGFRERIDPDDPASGVRTADVGPEDSSPRARSLQRLELVQIRALGNDARAGGDGRIELTAEENGLPTWTVWARQLNYDLRQRTLSLWSPEKVLVDHQGSGIACPRIVITLDENEEVATALCEGAGELHYRDPETGERLFSASWKKLFQKYPDPDSPDDIIEFDQDVTIWQPDRNTGMIADLVRIWVAGLSRDAVAGEPGSTSALRTIRPKRILALATQPQQNIGMLSPQFEGETRRLEIDFDDPTRLHAGTARPSHLRPAVYRVADGSDERSAVGQAFHSTGDDLVRAFATGAEATPSARIATPVSAAESASPRSSRPPLVIDSQRIHLQVTMHDAPDGKAPTLSLRQATAEGQVIVREKLPPEDEPLQVEGNELQLTQESAGKEVVHVFGGPAHIRRGGVHIEGGDIRLDRGANLARVKGVGLLQIPVDRDLRGEKLAVPQSLDVHWNEGMQFDGKAADFNGDVRAELSDSQMRCKRMWVSLSRRLSFAEDKPNVEGIELDEVICRDGVEFDNYAYEGDNLIEIRRASVYELTLNQVTGKAEALGPGWIKQWQRTGEARNTLSPSVVVQANRASTGDESEWEYVRVDFSRDMIGNIQQQHTTFHENVEIVYGPVERPMDVVDPLHLPKDGAWMRCKQLELTRVEPAGDQPAYVQLKGSGNTHLEGQTFSGWADTVSFDQSKCLFVLRSFGNPQANICQQDEVGGEYNRFDAQRIEFLPKLRQIHLDRVTGFGGVQ